MKSKKGLVLEIIFAIIALLLVIIVISGLQLYGLVKTINQERPVLESEINDLMIGNCSKIDSIELRYTKIEAKFSSACNNPIINIGISSLNNIPYKCNDIENVSLEFENRISDQKNLCLNNTLVS